MTGHRKASLFETLIFTLQTPPHTIGMCKWSQRLIISVQLVLLEKDYTWQGVSSIAPEVWRSAACLICPKRFQPNAGLATSARFEVFDPVTDGIS